MQLGELLNAARGPGCHRGAAGGPMGELLEVRPAGPLQGCGEGLLQDARQRPECRGKKARGCAFQVSLWRLHVLYRVWFLCGFQVCPCAARALWEGRGILLTRGGPLATPAIKSVHGDLSLLPRDVAHALHCNGGSENCGAGQQGRGRPQGPATLVSAADSCPWRERGPHTAC